MKHQRIILALLLLLVAASPVLVQGASKALSKPAPSANNQVSDNDNDDGNVGANHDADETGDHHDNGSATGADHEENKTAGHVDDDKDNDAIADVDSVSSVPHEVNETTDVSNNVVVGHDVNETTCVEQQVVPAPGMMSPMGTSTSQFKAVC